jgi:TetR/AcrR family transcriptional regulator, tetracycline repressor protein
MSKRPTRFARPHVAATRAKSAATKRSATKLSRESIVVAALQEIDDNGLDAFSLRNLAKRLGVYPTAIAWHVESRSQLLAEVAALALADILPPGFPVSWQSHLRTLFQRFREAIRRHPNVAPLVGTQLVANPGVDLDFVERLLATLAHAGFTGQRLVGAYNAVIAALVGFTTQEFAPIPADDTRAWQADVRARLDGVESFNHPILAANMKLLANHAFILRWQNGTENPLTESFAAFVEIVISGLEQASAEGAGGGRR